MVSKRFLMPHIRLKTILYEYKYFGGEMILTFLVTCTTYGVTSRTEKGGSTEDRTHGFHGRHWSDKDSPVAVAYRCSLR
jgi:hypothetical protein